MKRTTCVLFLLSSLLARTALSQVALGTPPFNSFGGGPFDAVNLGNLNVHFTVPIIQKAGRGTPFTYSLGYDSSIWTPVGTSGNQTWQPSSTWGWSATTLANSTPYISFTQTTGAVTQCGFMGQGSYYVINYSNYVYHDQFGLTHPTGGGGAYIVSTGGSSCPPGGPRPTTPTTYTAPDGSGYIFNFGAPGTNGISVTTSYRNGAQINAPVLSGPPPGPNAYGQTDANGNKISFDPTTGKYTDTLGKMF